MDVCLFRSFFPQPPAVIVAELTVQQGCLTPGREGSSPELRFLSPPPNSLHSRRRAAASK